MEEKEWALFQLINCITQHSQAHTANDALTSSLRTISFEAISYGERLY